MSMDIASLDLARLTALVTASYVKSHTVAAGDVPHVIGVISGALANVGGSPAEPSAPVREPMVPIKKSVTPEYIVCLDCGKRVKMLKRHLRTAHGLSVGEYRDRWNLPREYPMVAPSYAEKRSTLAVRIGLGHKRHSEE